MSNSKGRFGKHGGQYMPETLMNAVIELEEAYNHYKDDPEFNRELTELFNEYAGRPSRLYFAKKRTNELGGTKIYHKREDLNHTGSHKINNVLGQALLAKKMGKTRLIAETGAGQHGVATATAAALLGMECVVFMGEEDTKRQALNVYRMKLLGATVIPVMTGTRTLKDAVSEAMSSALHSKTGSQRGFPEGKDRFVTATGHSQGQPHRNGSLAYSRLGGSDGSHEYELAFLPVLPCLQAVGDLGYVASVSFYLFPVYAKPGSYLFYGLERRFPCDFDIRFHRGSK